MSIVSFLAIAATLVCQEAPGKLSRTQKKELASFKAGVERSPFFTYARKRYGEPAKCSLAWSSEDGSASYDFPSGVHFQSEVSHGEAGSESTELSLAGETLDEAVALVRTELHASFPTGCKVNWKKPDVDKEKDGGTSQTFHCPDEGVNASVTVYLGKDGKPAKVTSQFAD